MRTRRKLIGALGIFLCLLSVVAVALAPSWRNYYLRRSAVRDPQRVFLVGHSAGALFTALLAVQPEHLARAGVSPGKIRGFAMLSGVYDLTRLIAFSDAGLAAQVKASATAQDLERYSPERQVRTGPVAGSAPMLLLVGGDEEPAMRAEQRSMIAALGRAGANATSVEVSGADHMDMVMHLSYPGDRALAALARFIGQP